jgi:archaetidylinositol phosphate synthase
LNQIERIQDNLLAKTERRILTWICARLPMWVTPDRLTLVGFLGAVAVGTGYALSFFSTQWLWLSIAGYFINWFGDSLDGSLARFRHIERPSYGYFLDHSVDALANTILMIGLGLGPFVRLDVALFGLVAYLLMSVHTFIAARIVGEMRLSYLSGGPTELRILLLAMTSAMFVLDRKPIMMDGSWFDLFIGSLGVILVLVYIAQTSVTALRLRRKGA